MAETRYKRSDSVKTLEGFAKAGWKIEDAAADLLRLAHANAAQEIKAIAKEHEFNNFEAIKIWNHQSNVRLTALRMYFDLTCTKPAQAMYVEDPEALKFLVGINGTKDAKDESE
jgi:hypothetical protein